MSESPNCTVYIGNLDEKVSDRVLYDILIQAGRLVDLHIPRDRETDKPKGYAFAQYETEDIADYAVKLFSGLVTLYNRTLKFRISSSNSSLATPPTLNTSLRPRSHPVPCNDMEVSPHSARLSTAGRFSAHQINSQVPISPREVYQPNGYRSLIDGYSYDYSHRVFGATLDSFNRSRLGRYDTSNETSYRSF